MGYYYQTQCFKKLNNYIQEVIKSDWFIQRIKEIRKILADKNIFLDDGHISKIISLEKEKRKEV